MKKRYLPMMNAGCGCRRAMPARMGVSFLQCEPLAFLPPFLSLEAGVT